MQSPAPVSRRVARLVRGAVLLYSTVAMLAGAVLLFLAWRQSSQACAMLAVVLLLSSPVLAMQAMLPRPADLERDAEAIERIDRSLRMVHFCRAHIGVAAAGVILQWVSHAMGLVELRGFLVFYSIACLVAAAACLPWLSACELRLCEDRAELRRVGAERYPRWGSQAPQNG